MYKDKAGKVLRDFELVNVSGAVVTFKEKTLNFVSGSVSESFYLAGDCVIYLIDVANTADMVKTVSTSKLVNDYDGTPAANVLTADIYAVLNADGDVSALYINK